MNHLVELRQLPEGTPKMQLQLLVDLVEDSFKQIETAQALNVPITQTLYQKMLGTLIASLYVTTAQGRCQAIDKLTQQQVWPTIIC
ncbi:MAG: hypothetical protein Q8Q60_01645 [Candidatus Chromulinivorax sp.]|nr:hypothetical protein [Candidatus Chromulinivorax sp.]